MPRASRSAAAATRAAAASPLGCTHFKLRQLARRVGRHYDRVVGVAGLKTTQYSLLSAIARLGPIRPGELARAMAMEPSTLTRNLQPLVAQSLVEVGAGHDLRSRAVTITPLGQERRIAAKRHWKRAQLGLSDALGLPRVAALHAVLDECLAAVAAIDDDDPPGDA